MESISEAPDDATQTCTLRLRGGRLPDVPGLAGHLEALRVGAQLRGVEATVTGRLRQAESGWWLDVSGTGETLRIAPLERTVYWDFSRKREQRIKDDERGAFARLIKRRSERPVRLIGPLVRKEDGTYTLEVRRYEFSR